MSKSNAILALVVCAGSAAFVSSATAQAILNYEDIFVGGKGGAYDNQGMNYQENGDGHAQYYTGMDFSDVRGASLTRNGFTGSGQSSNDTLFSPSSPGIMGSFSGLSANLWSHADITRASGYNYWEEGSSNTFSDVYFSVSSPTPWIFCADVAAQTSAGSPGYSFAQHRISLRNLTTNSLVLDDTMFALRGGSYAYGISASGVLAPGSYVLGFAVGCQFDNLAYETGTGEAYVEIRNSCFAIPAPSVAWLLGLSGVLATRRRRMVASSSA